MITNQIICGAMPEATKVFPDGYFNGCISSPPYWALRDYSACDCTIDVLNPARTTAGPIKCTKGKQPNPNCLKCGGTGKDINVEKNQLGLEKTFEEYIDKLCTIYDEVKRVLRDDGICWVNLGDTYAGGGKGGGGCFEEMCQSFRRDRKLIPRSDYQVPGVPTKSLCLIPQRFAIEMVNRGWILRNVIIWAKPNPMPSSAKDRFTVSHEYVYFFVKSKKYWFEPQYEPHKEPERSTGKLESMGTGNAMKAGQNQGFGLTGEKPRQYNPLGRNKRTVWTIPTQSFPEAHFATFPEKLVEPMIKAGCPEFVCTKCGKGREKIYDTSYELAGGKGQEKYGDNTPDDGSNPGPQGMKYGRANAQHYFKGYTDCGCNAEYQCEDCGEIYD